LCEKKKFIAPTGSGKTVILEMGILQMITAMKDEINCKSVYLAPTKALCTERFYDWDEKFSKIGLSCIELTGDSDVTDYGSLMKTHILFDFFPFISFLLKLLFFENIQPNFV